MSLSRTQKILHTCICWSYYVNWNA